MAFKDWLCRRTGHRWEDVGNERCPRGNSGCALIVRRCERCGMEDGGENADNFRRCVNCTWTPPLLPAPRTTLFVYRNDRFPDKHLTFETREAHLETVVRTVKQADAMWPTRWDTQRDFILKDLNKRNIEVKAGDNVLFIDLKH